jgi:hypothetical protein
MLQFFLYDSRHFRDDLWAVHIGPYKIHRNRCGFVFAVCVVDQDLSEMTVHLGEPSRLRFAFQMEHGRILSFVEDDDEDVGLAKGTLDSVFSSLRRDVSLDREDLGFFGSNPFVNLVFQIAEFRINAFKDLDLLHLKPPGVT